MPPVTDLDFLTIELLVHFLSLVEQEFTLLPKACLLSMELLAFDPAPDRISVLSFTP